MKTLLLDIESAPNRVYAWGLFKQDIHIDQIEEPGYTLCWAAKWVGEQEVMFSSVWTDGPDGMLERIHTLLEEADVVVHFNGLKYDIPRLNTGFLLSGISPPAPFAQVDLYPVVKKRFAFPSNKLTYVCEQLGLGSKVAHKGMLLWREVMAGERDAQATMQKYNIQDIALLERLYNICKPWVIGHPNAGLYITNEVIVCPNCGGSHLQSRGLYHAKTQSYRRYRCMDCGKWSRQRTSSLSVEKRKSILVGVE